VLWIVARVETDELSARVSGLIDEFRGFRTIAAVGGAAASQRPATSASGRRTPWQEVARQREVQIAIHEHEKGALVAFGEVGGR
jgi:hypothetical protein